MDLFQDGSKQDTDVQIMVLQKTSEGPIDRKEKQQRNDTNGRCRYKTVATTYEDETWVCWTHHERQLGTFATTIPRGEIEGKRGQGRPRRNWMDDVKEWSGSASYGDTKRKAENGKEWRDMFANLRTEDCT
ncbi:eukaryotic translation initiation factor 3 subunit F [Elysia marginata]|uniref:Eukaryotic translation initiation factor 3 subunit F n=1 Tax=Elysia marginata TaxID=1093978 RepID=A0AAV4FWT4_9GAST|nr:eukaryotic translation initiation factor 3 subunit F [Elysia marginata]